MSDEDPENIFDAAANASNSKKKKKKRAASESTPGAELEPMSDAEMEKRFKRAEEQYAELKGQISDAYADAGVDPQDMSTWLSNPSNFTPDLWQAIEEARAEEEAALATRVGSGVQQAAEKKKRARKAKKRRGKFLGSRKNWLQMD